MSKVVAVEKDGTEIVGYRLDDGREFKKQDLIDRILTREISVDNIQIVESRYGEPYIRSTFDGDSKNNFQNLPTYGMSSGYGTSNNPHNRTEGYPHQIVAVRKDGSDIQEFKLEDGTVLSQKQAVESVRNKQIGGYVIGHSKYGEEYLRSYSDSSEGNNLQNLPEF